MTKKQSNNTTKVAQEAPTNQTDKTCILFKIFESILTARYNIGLIISTLVLWLSWRMGYVSNNNYDMILHIENYIMLTGVAAMIVATLKYDKSLMRLSVITIFLSMFALPLSKSLYPLIASIGVAAFVPSSIFCSLLLLKNIWSWVKTWGNENQKNTLIK